jgi:UDPglucose 6-dehydrogenase
MRIAVVGANYVGLATAACLAGGGHDVTVLDEDTDRVRALAQGQPSRYEAALDELIRASVNHDRLSFSRDWANALRGTAIAFICSDAQDETGKLDRKPVTRAAKLLGDHLTGSLLVVVRSTVPCGTGELVERVLRLRIQSRGLQWVALVASNPDFSKEGSFVRDFTNPDRIILGVDKGAGEALLRELYQPYVNDDPGKLIVMDRRSAELTKYASDAMLATRVSLMNELSRLCDAVHADIDQVRRGIGGDARIGPQYLLAGPGFGGSAFLRFVESLNERAADRGVPLSVLHAVCEVNHEQRVWLAEKITRHFGDVRGKVVAVWGLSYKPFTEDTCASPALDLVRHLLDAGAHVVAHDPVAIAAFQREIGRHANLSFATHAYQALEGADALVLATEWPEYLRPNWPKVARLMRSKNVFDWRNQYSCAQLTRLGFHYSAVGRPDSEHPPVRLDLCQR